MSMFRDWEGGETWGGWMAFIILYRINSTNQLLGRERKFVCVVALQLYLSQSGKSRQAKLS